MAEPLSFVASVIAVASLAENVVTKGYHYLKAVKDCPKEVRSLMAEVNVLCGILERLKVLLQGNKSKLGLTTNPENGGGLDLEAECEEAEESEERVDSKDEVTAAHGDTLHPPDFIYECRRTLHEIEDILRKFGRTSAQSIQPSAKALRFNVSSLRRLEAKDLKWPLRRSKTMQLIDALERHKSTCTLALAENGLIGVHTVLEQTKLSNKHLAELKAKQEKIFELNITHEQEKALAWLSPVNPASKLKEFRRDRQRGTGTWLFDLSEMSTWLETSNSALWIYGIPGAGKTMLSTLVVDEVLTRKRSSSIGTAYFYIRHDDHASHVPSNVLGSLLSQLARQHPSALDDVMELHAQHSQVESLPTVPEVDELIVHLHSISKWFTDTFILIDGLDECGLAFDLDRKRLIDAVAGLHRNEDWPLHTLIFSRDELDIRKGFHVMEFQMVSIAATSADLRLYVSAWLPSLEIQNETLKTEIVDTLVDEANGMFMWVRAQVDYLQRLPNDIEKRKALKKLPPDLPQTYIRIFEMIDSMYPMPTTIYVQRLLKWLVLGFNDATTCSSGVQPELTSDTLRQAICIENESVWHSDAAIATTEQLFRWLGCLVRKSEDGDAIHLSHFTVREFLNINPDNVNSSIARKYLVKPQDVHYMLNVCLTYVMHDNFKSITCSSVAEVDSFLSKNPLFKYVAIALCDHVWAASTGGLDCEGKSLVQRFLSTPPHQSFELWATCIAYLDLHENVKALLPTRRFPSPLHFASFVGLADEVRRLLELGLDPDYVNPSTEKRTYVTPLHLAICSASKYGMYFDQGTLELFIDPGDQSVSDAQKLRQERSLLVIRILVDFGADVDQQLNLKMDDISSGGKLRGVRVTPLVLAVACGSRQAASLLLDAGANWNAVADEDTQGRTDLCSIERLSMRLPQLEDTLQQTIDFGGHHDLKKALESYKDLRDTKDCDTQSTDNASKVPKLEDTLQQTIEFGGHYDFKIALKSYKDLRDTKDCDTQSTDNASSDNATSQELFIDAYQNRDWQAVRDLLTTRSDIEVNCNDEEGGNAVFCASAYEEEGNALICLLEHGANPNLLTSTGYSALLGTVVEDCFKNMSLLLQSGANIEQREPGGWTPLLRAVFHRRREALKLLLDRGADIHAMLDDGTSVLHLATDAWDSDTFSLLLARGVDSTSPDNYGTEPLHKACRKGQDFEVGKLVAESIDSIDSISLVLGTPLYVAARFGYDDIVKRLLDAGAVLDKTGPGNVLGSALMAACSRGHTKIVKLLLSRGASLEVEGSRFKSAAGTARAFRQEAVLKVLE